MDLAHARRMMVDGQLRPNRVADARVLAAMRDLPREAFLPAPLRSRAYLDEDVALGGGRVLLEPMILARLVQLAAIRTADRVLVVGCGTGYGAAVIARLGASVIALESDERLRALAADALAATTPTGAVHLITGPLPEGHPAAAPYAAILVEGSIPAVPPTLIAQLAEGGRLVTVLPGEGGADRAMLGQRVGGTFSLTPAFDCATAPLPEFAAAPAFAF